jgi:hypothetical protein
MTPSSTSIILDIETLSRRPHAIITEIGVIAFNRADFVIIDEIVIRPGFYPQIEAGRHLCNETLQFHRKNKTLPMEVSDQDPALSIRDLADFIRRHNPKQIWIQGPDFDRPILESFHQDNGAELPWDYWRVSDSRTTWNLAFPGVKHDKRPHSALGDCKATLRDLANSLLTLNRVIAA